MNIILEGCFELRGVVFQPFEAYSDSSYCV